VDKELFKAKSQIGLKNPAKPFPLHTDVGVLKWRFQTQDESCIPLSSKYHKYVGSVEKKAAFGRQYCGNEHRIDSSFRVCNV
jgi:hypothetical protein